MLAEFRTRQCERSVSICVAVALRLHLRGIGPWSNNVPGLPSLEFARENPAVRYLAPTHSRRHENEENSYRGNNRVGARLGARRAGPGQGRCSRRGGDRSGRQGNQDRSQGANRDGSRSQGEHGDAQRPARGPEFRQGESGIHVQDALRRVGCGGRGQGQSVRLRAAKRAGCSERRHARRCNRQCQADQRDRRSHRLRQPRDRAERAGGQHPRFQGLG